MTDHTSTNGPLLQRRLGGMLKKARTEAKVSQTAVGSLLRCTRVNVSNIEVGRQGVSDAQLTLMLNTYGASDELRKQVFDLVEQVRNAPKAWWDDYSDLFPAQTFAFWPYEDAASVIYSFTGTSVPGMLQTRGYAEALARFFYPDESDRFRERFVESRLKRIGVFERGKTRMTYVFQECALTAQVGGKDVLKEQVERLVELAEHPMISLRVIPNRHPMTALAGPMFTILEFPDDEPVLHVATVKGASWLLQGGRVVEEERRRFRVVEAAALSDEDSFIRIKKAASL